jgi:hypothetical protein
VSDRLHEQAEVLAAQAEVFNCQGDSAKAEKLYDEAANKELLALEKVSPEKTRTYSAIALSALALLLKARRFSECEMRGYSYLAVGGVEEYARAEMREIVDTALDEMQLFGQGRRYAKNALEVALFGGNVGFGTAGLGAVLEQMGSHQAITRRVAEWKLGLPFRAAGPPPASVDDLLDVRVSQPVAGSYRFSIRMTEEDPSLFDCGSSPGGHVDEILTTTFHLIRSTVAGDRTTVDALQAPPDYLKALTRLVRNLIPDGKTIGRVEVKQPLEKSGKNTVSITKEIRPRISAIIRELDPTPPPESVTIEGTLRALNLDQRYIEIVDLVDQRFRLIGKEAMLDDVIGPMVNKRVAARAVPLKRNYRLIDIDKASDE